MIRAIIHTRCLSAYSALRIPAVWAFVLLLAGLLSHGAAAQSLKGAYSGLQTFGEVLLPDETQFTLGIGPRYSPDYPGSDDYEVRPDFVFFARLGKFLIFDNDGIRIDILGSERFKLGPVVKLTGGRHEKSNPALTGLGNIGPSLEVGGFVKLILSDKVSARLRYRQGVTGHDGDIVDLELTTLLYRRGALSLAGGIRANWAGAKVMRRFFGIDAQQAARSGLPEFRLGSAVSNTRLNLSARWAFKKPWSLNGYVQYDRLLGRAADSPIVRDLGSPNGFAVGIFVARMFAVD